MNKALFLDRDGVINVDYGYVGNVNDFHFVDGVFELCHHFQKQGYLLIVITNQAGISKNKYTINDFHLVNEFMLNAFALRNVQITEVFYEASPDENHYRRKPNPGMLIEAINKYQIDPKESLFIGDKESDMEAARRADIAHKYYLEGNYPAQSGKDYKIVRKLDEITNDSRIEL